MKSLIAVLCLLVLLGCSHGAPQKREAPDTDAVRCSSLQFKREQCPTNAGRPIASLSVQKQLSRTKCCGESCDGKPANYGFSGDVVWVDEGCRADFKVTYGDDCPLRVNSEMTLQKLNFESGGWLNIFLDLPFSESGKVAQWEFFSQSVGTFYAGVWRSLGNNQYQLIGRNQISSNAQYTRHTYVVPAGQQIEAEAGDVIGIHYNQNVQLGVVPYEHKQISSPGMGGYTLSRLINVNQAREEVLDLDPTVTSNVQSKRRAPALVAHFCKKGCDPSSTGDDCITSCQGQTDGDYQSCAGCNMYASCVHGHLYDKRPCARTHPGTPPLQWDDKVKRCEWESPTCKECRGP